LINEQSITFGWNYNSYPCIAFASQSMDGDEVKGKAILTSKELFSSLDI
jgi:hypothetical protein